MTLSLFVVFIGAVSFVVGDVNLQHYRDVLCSPPEFFKCRNERCLASFFVCDNDDDCGDNSDELNCPGNTKQIVNIACSEDQFQCRDKTCILKEEFCDRQFDCPDMSDEYVGCTKEKQCDEFQCKNGYCVRKEWVCDGFNDCWDFSDETDCENGNVTREKCDNELGRFLCDHGRCIGLNKTCDGRDDCGDGSDEHATNCKKSSDLCTIGIGCSQNCVKTPRGPICSCWTGYRLIGNRTCIDADECTDDDQDLCDQRCKNTVGSYHCECERGYELQEDKRTCRVPQGEYALMVFSTKREIRGIYLGNELYFPIVENVHHATGVTLDENYVYWSDIKNDDAAIFRSYRDGTKWQLIVTAGLGVPEVIAVDWITGNLYFTDSQWMRIGVCKNDGEFCTVIVKDLTEKPRGLALHPASGEMFWSEFGERARISRAGMDGRDVRELVTDNVEWPNCLAIDYPARRVYWVDAKREAIESVRLDGTGRRQVVSATRSHPYAIAVFEDRLYWSDWETKTIQVAEKNTGKNRSSLIREFDAILGIHIYHSALKPPKGNPCGADICSELCLLASSRPYSCACTLDKELSVDRHSCRPVMKKNRKNKKHLAIAFEDAFVEYYHEILGRPRITRSSTLKRVTRVAYDSITGDIIANDRTSDSLFRFSLENRDLVKIAGTKSEYLAGLDFDWRGNNVYWSDIRHLGIEVHSLNTGSRTVFRFAEEEPRDIALVPEHETIFVVFRSRASLRIDRLPMSLNGTRERLVEDLRGPTVSLAYDPESERLFWADENTGRIESIAVDNRRGNDRKLFRVGLREPVSLAVVDDDVFWTLRNSHYLQWGDKLNRVSGTKTVTLGGQDEAEIVDMTTITGLNADDRHPCRTNNGGCSHVCLLSTDPDLRVCACPPGMHLDSDKRNCNLQTVCTPDEIRCSDNNECINKLRRCNGIDDCPNGEDEEKCDHVNTCDVGKFMCRNGECIDVEKRCNLAYDCADRSDEVNCNMADCKKDEFQCLNGECISKFHVCDTRIDCGDASDETNCHRHVCDEESFQCASGGCIPKSWECDGSNDCVDSSDEVGDRCRVFKCPDAMFQCANKRCLDRALLCDKVDDCGDNTDEEKPCDSKTHGEPLCSANEYKCYGTEKCIPSELRCNGEQDCPKNDDEHLCIQCEPEEFMCANKNCVHRSWVCDKVDDCGDKSDETDCDFVNHEKFENFTYRSAENCREFKCKIGNCLPYDKVCDGKPDCFDFSDEGGKCESSCTGAESCEQICHKTPEGSICDCQKGYELMKNSSACVDVNECEQETCSQICRNVPGSFVCSCFAGHVLRNDRRSCKVAGEPMQIITATRTDIRRLTRSLSSIEVIHRQPNIQVTGLDVNMRLGTIYWSNEIMGTVSRFDPRTGDSKWIDGLGKPGKLAIDWATGNVYLHDGQEPSSMIKACDIESQQCSPILKIENNSARLTSIAVDSTNGWLFWSQTRFQVYEPPIGEIYRANLLGSSRIIIARENIGVVTGITVDHGRSHLYWADALLDLVERSNLDGSERQVFLKHQVFNPLGINIYEDHLYWLMGSSGVLKKCPLHGDKICESINVQPTNVNELFVISQETRQPEVKNVCEKNVCDHMCVMGGNREAVCKCPDGSFTDSNELCGKNEIVGNPIHFESSMFGKENTNYTRSRSVLFVGIFITIVIGLSLMLSTYYYQKKKCSFRDQQDFSVHFRNPTFGVAVPKNDYVVPVLPPGEHEYTNPMVDTKPVNKDQKTAKRKVVELSPDYLENELEEISHNQNTHLIS